MEDIDRNIDDNYGRTSHGWGGEELQHDDGWVTNSAESVGTKEVVTAAEVVTSDDALSEKDKKARRCGCIMLSCCAHAVLNFTRTNLIFDVGVHATTNEGQSIHNLSTSEKLLGRNARHQALTK